MFTRRAVYSTINFLVSPIAIDKTPRGIFLARMSSAIISDDAAREVFEARFIAPPRVYRRVNHCTRSNASATFISQSRALSRPVNILLSQVNTPNSRGRWRGRKNRASQIDLSRFYAGHLAPSDRIAIARFIERYSFPPREKREKSIK